VLAPCPARPPFPNRFSLAGHFFTGVRSVMKVAPWPIAIVDTDCRPESNGSAGLQDHIKQRSRGCTYGAAMTQNDRRRHPDEEALLTFVQTAKPRQSYVYGSSERRASRSVMELARYLQTNGLVTLVQKRDPRGFAYTAIRTSKSNNSRSS